jgi:hypothetical protein
VRRAKDGADRDLIDLLLEDGLEAAEIGARVGLTANQVYKLRSRPRARGARGAGAVGRRA